MIHLSAVQAKWVTVALSAVAAMLTVKVPAQSPPPPPEISGAYYDWQKTRLPERPYLHPYHQTLVMKIFLAQRQANEGCQVYLTFEEALEVIRKLDRLTCELPKIVYLVGWQFHGHDSKYPSWAEVNPRLKRPRDATPAESLRWLMDEARQYHTTVSLHINMFDAYQNSPLWAEYLQRGIIAKDTDGALIQGEVADVARAAPRPDNQVYYVSYAREWETGLAKRRIDGLLAMLPVQRAGTIHIDAFHSLRPIPHAYPQEKYPRLSKADTRISPFLDYPLEREVAAQRKIFRYFRDQGVDVTSEGSTFLRPDAFVGLQPMAWDYQAPAPGIPPSLYCGTPMRAEPEIKNDPKNLGGLLEPFCLQVVPWYYQNNTTAPKGQQPTREDDDLFMPALWKDQLIVAFSRKGYTEKAWSMPPGWERVSRVVVTPIDPIAPGKGEDREVTAGKLTLSLNPGQGVSIAPAATADPTGFAAPLPASFQVRPLPGHPAFVFTLYGAPGELEPLQQLVQVMRDRQLGNGFDPGPTPRPHAKPLFDYLAGVGWPVMCYPGYADMQIKGGRCVLGPEDEAALAAMDRAGVFTAVQLGEWGYYFHNLSPNEPWWRDVYGKEFETFKHLMKPPGLAGYDRRPAGRRECYETLKDYFSSRRRDLLGRVISVTGHSHYEAYAGEWGARCIGLEVGENIAFTQSKFAFARGASRQWQVPWAAQVSPWFSGACTTSGPLRQEAGGARGLDAGHSLSLYERMWLHAWFAGAAMVTPENSVAIFFETAAAPWTLTAHGRKASEVFQFMRTHERGVPFTPVAIVLDHLAGYNGYMDKPWGILEPTAGDRQVRDLFDHQLFPGSDHIHHRPDPDNPEASYLRPTPYGEMFDAQLTSASAEMLSSYPVILLAGDIEFDDALVAKLEHALKQGRRLLLAPAHQAALGARFATLAKHPGLEVLPPWTSPATGRPTAISERRLERLVREVLPLEVSGDPIQYQVNRAPHGWVIELVNNAGVAKKPNQPATTDPGAVARVVLHPRIPCASAREWRSNRSFAQPAEIPLEVGPGQSVFVELLEP